MTAPVALSGARLHRVAARRADDRRHRQLPASTLLQALLRHALLREYAVAAARIAAADGAGELPSLLRDAELVDLVADAPQTVTWQRLLDRPAPTGSGAATVRVLLEHLTGFDRPEVAGLGATRRALAHLRTLDDDTLRLLTAGTLDAAGHRLDAWVTSFATRRLADLRAATPAGLGVGGYGWVENLAAGPPHPPWPTRRRARRARSSRPRATPASSTRRRLRMR